MIGFLKWFWSPAVYWPQWLGMLTGTFLLREVWALASGRPNDTLSYWVWVHLHIVSNERISQWTAASFLTFGVWIVLVTWLTFHFWLHKFAG
jgi:hypothetical protein